MRRIAELTLLLVTASAASAIAQTLDPDEVCYPTLIEAHHQERFAHFLRGWGI